MAKNRAKKTSKSNNAYVKPVAFNSMTPTQRRVAIAQDVIAGLKAKRFIATQGIYVDVLHTKSCDFPANGTIDVQKVLAQSVVTCGVCAKGAMFIAAVEKFNRLKFNRINRITSAGDLSSLLDYNANSCNHLCNYFPLKTINLIERIFEDGGDGASSLARLLNDTVQSSDQLRRLSVRESLAKAAYVILYPEPEDRLSAIMENIVANNGKFVLSVKLV